MYVQLFFVIDRLKHMAEADPTLLDQPHFKAATTDDLTYFIRLDPVITSYSIHYTKLYEQRN